MHTQRAWVLVSELSTFNRFSPNLYLSLLKKALLTISHRPALYKYHQYLLRLTGNHGQWEMETIGTQEQQQSLEKEMQSLEAKLQEVEALKARLGAIDKELSLKL